MSDLEDAYRIEQVRKTWAWSTDSGDWNGLRACFHSDAWVEVSWYHGNVEGYIAGSQAMASKRAPAERGKHWLGNMRTQIRGDRAILETDVQIQMRNLVDGHLLDATSYARFYDCLERREGSWRIWKWYTFYDKDRLDPVIPGSVPASYFDAVSLGGANGGFEFMRFRQERQGRTTIPGLTMGRSEQEVESRAEATLWLTSP